MIQKQGSKVNTSSVLQIQWRRLAEFLHQCSVPKLSLILMLVAVIVQLPLVFNPGYFSHDELQWASRADVSALKEMTWIPWLAIDLYQYRPLTFNLWLGLSYLFFDHPFVFHGILVIWGAFNAALLIPIMRHYQVNAAATFSGVLFFVLTPYALYVHGWVGTMADMLVMSALLLLVLIIIKTNSLSKVVLATLLLTVVALISKESALAIPGIFAVAWLFDGRKSSWLVASIVSGLVVTAYLWLRLPVLLQQPEDTPYTLNLLNMPKRWLEYHLYWILAQVPEPHSIFSRGLRTSIVVAGILMTGFWLIMWQANRKLALACLLGGIAALFPVLPIASSAGQYGYLFAAWTVMMVTAIWKFCGQWQKRLLALLAALSLLHGMDVMRKMRHAGNIQAVFSPELANIVEQWEADRPIRLHQSPNSSVWVFIRLTHDIHSYQGIKIGNKVQIVEHNQSADYLIQPDGYLTRIMD